jgi:hypothetical protein
MGVQHPGAVKGTPLLQRDIIASGSAIKVALAGEPGGMAMMIESRDRRCHSCAKWRALVLVTYAPMRKDESGVIACCWRCIIRRCVTWLRWRIVWRY